MLNSSRARDVSTERRLKGDSCIPTACVSWDTLNYVVGLSTQHGARMPTHTIVTTVPSFLSSSPRAWVHRNPMQVAPSSVVSFGLLG